MRLSKLNFSTPSLFTCLASVLACSVFSGCAAPSAAAPSATDDTSEELHSNFFPTGGGGGDDGGSQPINPPPRNLSASATSPFDASIVFTCGANATSHKVMRSIDNSPYSQQLGLAVCQPGVSPHLVDSNIHPGHHHCYFAIGANDQFSAVSNTDCFDAPFDFTAPTAPDLGYTDIGETTATIIIIDRSTNETGFRVYLDSTSLPPYTTILRTNGPDRTTGERLTVQLTGLAVNSSHTVFVQAFHDDISLSGQASETFQTLPAPPTAPVNFTLSTGQGATGLDVRLIWQPGQNVESYEISAEGPNVPDQSLPETATTFTYANLVNNSTAEYCFTVTSVNRTGRASSPRLCTTDSFGPKTLDVRLMQMGGNDLFQGAFGLAADTTLLSIEMPTDANRNPPFTGFTLVPPRSKSSADCNSSNAVNIPLGGSISGDDIAKIFGSTMPGSGQLIQGCPMIDAGGSSNLVTILRITYKPKPVQ